MASNFGHVEVGKESGELDLYKKKLPKIARFVKDLDQ